MTATDPAGMRLPEHLAHLLHRAERGVILPAEARQLRDIITELHQELADAAEDYRELREIGHDIAVYAGLIPPVRTTALPAHTQELTRG